MVGMNKVPDKERRKMRRFNHMAKDLRTPKYAQRVIKNKKKGRYIGEEQEDDDYDYDY
jgi:hypothetical protein